MSVKVDRLSQVGLVDQIAAILKADILAGKYATGTHLPSAQALGRLVGTSEKPVRGALRVLTKEGWIRPVRGVGSVVQSRSIDAGNRGHVLIVYASAYQSYFFSTVRESLQAALFKKGYRVSIALVSRRSESERRRNLAELRELLTSRWDLIIESGYQKDARSLIEASGIPFVSMAISRTFRVSAQARSTFFVRMGAGLSEFYRAAAKRAIRSVWQFLIAEGGFDITESMRILGCSVRTFRQVPSQKLYNATACYVVSELKKAFKERKKLPDVILFGDDHFCLPALATILASGYRIPEDVQVVTFSNKGDEPPFLKRLTRIELDVPDAARQMSQLVISVLTGKDVPSEVVVESCWTPGETF